MSGDRSRSDTERRFHEINETYFAGAMTPADWDCWYTERLRAVLGHVVAESPFYARHLAGVDPVTFTRADLPSLPTTDKADLRREQHDILSGSLSSAAVYYETTGTTGKPTPCPRGPLEVETSNAHVEESWRRLFTDRYGQRSPVVALMGPAELYAFCDTFHDVARSLDVAQVKLWPESPRVGFAKALRLLSELRAEVVVCAPALCLNLAKAALHYGYDLRRDFAIKQFLVLGEICTPAFRDNVRSVWQAEVLPTLYGSQEALAIATGCTHGRLHLSQPNYVAELLDPDTGAVLGDTGSGDLCLTMLAPGIKPLIRYRTGDHVMLTRGGCGCGYPGDVVDVLGRCDDGVPLGSGVHTPGELETAVLEGVRGCLGYQIAVDEHAGVEEITVRLDLIPKISGEPAEICEGIAHRLGQLCGRAVRVEVEDELDPITNTGAFVSWKAARIADRRKPDDPEVASARRAAAAHVVTT